MTLAEVVLAGGLAGAFLLQVSRWGTKGAFANIGVTFLGVIYIGLLGSFLVRIRQMGWSSEDVYTPLQGVYYLAVFGSIFRPDTYGGNVKNAYEP